MRVSKITIGRLYNLGSYEHVRYELTAEIPEGESAATAIIGMEKILAGLKPTTHTHSRPELEREKASIERMREELATKGTDEFRRLHGHFVGTCEEYIARCAESCAKNIAERDAWEKNQKQARHQLHDLGGAANWKDAKLDWDNDLDGDY